MHEIRRFASGGGRWWKTIVTAVHGSGGNDADSVLGWTEKIAATGAVIGSLEQLVRSAHLDDDGLFSWPVHRTGVTGISRFPLKVVAPLLEYPHVIAVPQTRFLAALRLLLGNPGPRERALLLSTLTGTGAAMNIHHRYGNDGSDHMSFVVFLATTLARLFPDDERVKNACLQFIAFQSCLSYATSGAIKLVSPVWRSGDAITGIFRTESYGDAWLYRLVKLHPTVPRVLGWTVILGELAFPLVLVAPKPVAKGILTISAVFHLANGRFMGLNRFVWAFTSTYPAVAHASRSLRS